MSAVEEPRASPGDLVKLSGNEGWAKVTEHHGSVYIVTTLCSHRVLAVMPEAIIKVVRHTVTPFTGDAAVTIGHPTVIGPGDKIRDNRLERWGIEFTMAPGAAIPKAKPITDYERIGETDEEARAGALRLSANMVEAGIACRVCLVRVGPGGRYSGQGEPGRKTYLCPECWKATLVERASVVGSLTVITGPMFSGKTTELRRRIEREERAGRTVAVYRPAVDTRAARSLGGHTFSSPTDLIRSVAQTVVIDEAQFAPEWLPGAVFDLVAHGHRVIVAGLDLDAMGRPFGPMPYLMALASEVLKLTAVCVQCGADATRTTRLVEVEGQVHVGDGREYEARCFACWANGMREVGV